MIHWLTKADMPKVLDIEGRSNEYYDEDFDCTTARANAWEVPDFIELMRQPGGAGRVVTDDEGVVVGFLLYENMKDYVLIYKIVIDPNHRLKGYATKLLDQVKKKLTKVGTKKERLVILVSEQDTGTQLFLKKRGFRATDVIRGEDAAYKFEFEFEEKSSENAA